MAVVPLQSLQAVESTSDVFRGDWPTTPRSSATSRCVIWCSCSEAEAAAGIFSDYLGVKPCCTKQGQPVRLKAHPAISVRCLAASRRSIAESWRLARTEQQNAEDPRNNLGNSGTLNKQCAVERGRRQQRCAEPMPRSLVLWLPSPSCLTARSSSPKLAGAGGRAALPALDAEDVFGTLLPAEFMARRAASPPSSPPAHRNAASGDAPAPAPPVTPPGDTGADDYGIYDRSMQPLRFRGVFDFDGLKTGRFHRR